MLRMSTAAFTALLLAATASLTATTAAPAQDAAKVDADAQAIGARTLFVVSGGFWENQGGAEAGKAATDTPGGAAAAPDASADANAEPELPSGRGYYRVIAIRQPDNTSRVFLQQVALTDNGPQLVATRPIDEINGLAGYVTDVRQEKSDGVVDQPGLTAYVFIKRDPKETEPDTWTIFVDEYGAVSTEHTSN